MMAKAVDGRLYVIGGELDGASTGRPEIFVNHVWMHDPAVGGWAQRAPMPTAEERRRRAVIDGKIYVAGGRPPGGSAFEVYDPATDRWEKLPDLPTQRNHLAMAAVNGRIYVVGGRAGPGADAERVDVVEIYDPATRRWTRGAPLPAPRGGITGAVHAGCLFVFGGEGERTHVLGLTPTAYGYDPRADRWTTAAEPPHRRPRPQGQRGDRRPHLPARRRDHSGRKFRHQRHAGLPAHDALRVRPFRATLHS